MKLIDADELEIDEIDGVRCYSILQVDEALPVQAVPIEILDKIRAEVLVLDDADYDYDGYYKAVTDALKIIDKYRAESEDLGDYPDVIHNQFDNMTGGMNL